MGLVNHRHYYTRDNILRVQVEEIPDARKKIHLFGFPMPKRRPVKAVK